MGKNEKKVQKWLHNPPTDEPVERVEAVLKHFFGTVRKGATSHIVVQDTRLEGMDDIGPDNDFSVPIRGGQKVKKQYLRRIAEAVQYMGEVEED
jgi:hypothetical protein